MRRLTRAELPDHPRIALISNDSLGNFVMSTPLAQMIRRQYEGCRLVLFCGGRVSELSGPSDLFDEVVDLYGPSPVTVMRDASTGDAFDWVLNMERSPLAMSVAAVLAGEEGCVTGPCVGDGGRGELAVEDTVEGQLLADKEWINPGITEKYSFLNSGFIGEIFARTAYLEGPVPPYRLAQDDPGEVPDVLIATAASLSSKLWPVENWARIVSDLAAEGLTVGLLGAKPSDQAKFWKGSDDESRILELSPLQDLRGKFSLPQVVGALDRAKLVVTIDNGILHLACATKTPTVGLFRNGIHRLWAPPVPNLQIVEPGVGREVSQLSPSEIWGAIKNFQMPLTYF